MIERVLASQIGATVRTSYAERGFSCEIAVEAHESSSKEDERELQQQAT